METIRQERLWGNFLDVNKKYFEHANPHAANNLVNISLAHKYIYVATPKTGCSTILVALQRFELDDRDLTKCLNDIHGREFSLLLRAQQVGSLDRVCRRPDFLKFCFVRNPNARLLSTYLDRIGNSKEQKMYCCAQ